MPHRSPITCVDHHAGTGLLVTGGYDGRVIAWRQGRELWSSTFDDLINDVRIDDRGTGVAVAAADTYAYVLDAGTGAQTAALGPHGDDVNVVRWLPRGAGLVCTMDHVEPAARVWEPGPDGWGHRELARHGSGVFGAAVSPDGTRVATAAEDATARIWDLATGAELRVLDHPGDPETIDWSPDGTLIATGCDDDICRLWDPDTGAVVRTLTDATAAVRFVRFSPDGGRLLVGAYDATLRCYDTTTWQVVDHHQLPVQWERAACFTAEGVAVGSFGAVPVHHPPLDPAPVAPTFGINGLAVTPDHLLVARDDGAVLDVLQGRVVTRHRSIVNTVSVSPDGTTAASADYRGELRLTDLATGREAPVEVGRGGPINSAVWSGDGGTVFTAGYDGHIRIWTARGEPVEAWAAHHSPIKSLAWSSVAGGILVAGSSDGTLSAWAVGGTGSDTDTDADSDTGAGRERWRASRPDLVLVNAVAVADGAGIVVSASRDLRLRCWDVTTGALVELLPRVHHKSVKAVAVSPDGARIVSGAYDGLAVAWERQVPAVATGEAGAWAWRVLRLHGKPGVPAVGVTATNLFTAGWDGTVGRWNDQGELVTRYTPPQH